MISVYVTSTVGKNQGCGVVECCDILWRMDLKKDEQCFEEGLMERVGVVVFDMDGTLYKLDSEDGRFSSSSLCKQMFENTIQFIMDREDIEYGMAERIMREALKHEVGMSVFLAEKYGITRKDYFDTAWNIDPKGIITDFGRAVETVRKIASRGKKMILLTQAPSVWQRKVLDYLEISDCFDEVYTAEDFKLKTEIFEKVKRESGGKVILSVGDQFETDIKPARELGMEVFLVENPNDLVKLVE